MSDRLSYKIVRAMGNKYESFTGEDTSQHCVDQKLIDEIEEDADKPITEEGKRFLEDIKRKYGGKNDAK